MPEISRFLGIIIYMYYKDHAPPHFHAKYGEYKAAIAISDFTILEGKLPKRVMSLILEWSYEHREELIADWKLAEGHKQLHKIAPLV